jgi:tRNA (cytidine/uridine-2'-O-)-methyltransferase
MFEVILHQPDIPANTGNIIRLCANTGCRLHLIEPLGFRLDRRSVRRAALDYGELANVHTHKTLAGCLEQLPAGADGAVRLFAIETGTGPLYHEARFVPGDALLFGSETRGLPQALLAMLPAERRLRLPMQPGNRSLNLSNAVAITIYEAWRQIGFASCTDTAAARRGPPAAAGAPVPAVTVTATAVPSRRAGG